MVLTVSRHIQTSFAAGEFDPLLSDREDLTFFYSSAYLLENVVPLPQGGAKRRPGYRFRALQRGILAREQIVPSSSSAPNGGTVANLFDNDPSTQFISSTLGSATEYVIATWDMGSDTQFDIIELDDCYAPGHTSDFTVNLKLQYSSDNSNWTEAGSMMLSGEGSGYERRFANEPDTALGNARYWRIIVDNAGAVDLSAVQIDMDQIYHRREDGKTAGSPNLGNFQMMRLTASIEDEYILVMTSQNIDVYRADTGAFEANIQIPYTNAQVSDVKYSSNLDTIFLYHPDVAPQQITRVTTTGDWVGVTLTFDSITEFPFGDANVSGGVNEIQEIKITNFSNSGTGATRIAFELNGQVSDEVNCDGLSSAQFQTAVESALEGLDDISSVTIAIVQYSNSADGTEFRVEFDGDDGEQPQPLLICLVYASDSAISDVTRYQSGRLPFDELWSATRGYPSCGCFYQDRHWMSGFKSRPDLIIASRVGGYFDFKEDADPVANSPIVIAPNVGDQITVHDLFAGRHLHVFSSSAELYIPSEPISTDNIALKLTTRHGKQQKSRPLDIQGGTLFIDRNGDALREYLFLDAEQSYSAEPVSLLSGHLVNSPNTVSLKRSSSVEEPRLILLSNTGTDTKGEAVPAAYCILDRAQQISGMSRVKTDGTIQAFETSQSGEAFVMVQRSLAGETWNYLEQFDSGCLSDCSSVFAASGSVIDVSAYPHLEGQTVYVHADGIPLETHTVTSGSIDLGDDTVTAEVEVGLEMKPRIVLQGYKGKSDISVTMERQRIFRVLLNLERTSSVSVGMYGKTPKSVSINNFDSGIMDETADELLFTGQKRVSGIGSWELLPRLEITQTHPMPFLLRSVAYDINV